MNPFIQPCKAQRSIIFILILFFGTQNGNVFSQSLSGNNPDIHVSGYGDHSTYTQEHPVVASNGTNGFFVAWSDSRDGDNTLWAQYYDQEGIPVEGNFLVPNSSAINNIKYLNCAMGSSGNVMVAWNEFDQGLLAKCYKPDHTVLKDEFELTSSNVFKSSFTLASMQGGGFMVAYFKTSGKGLFIKRYDNDGSEIGEPVQIHTGDGYEYPDMIIKPTEDMFYISWVESSSPTKQYIMSLDYDLNVVGQPAVVRESSYGLVDYDFGLTSDDKLEVYYPARPGNKYEIVRTIFNKQCVMVGSEEVVSPEYLGSYFEPKVIKRTGSSTLLAVLCRGGQLASFEVSDSNVPTELSILGDDFGHYFMNTRKSQLSFSGNSSGNMMLAFVDHRHYYSNDIPDNSSKHSLEDDIYGQLIRPGGTKLGINFLINDDVAAEVDVYPSVCIDESNNKQIVWQYRDYDNPEVISQQLGDNGSLIGSNSLVVNDPDSLEQFAPLVASGSGNNNFVVWADQRKGWDIEDSEVYGQLYDKSHNKVGGNILIQAGEEVRVTNELAIAPDNEGGFVIVWVETNDSWNGRIMAKTVSENGQLTSESVQISPDNEDIDCQGPDVRVSPSGEIVVSYVENEAARIYFQICSNDLTSIGSSITAYVESNYLSTSSRIAMADNGNFCILAEESDGMFIQYVNADASLDGEAVKVSDVDGYYGVTALETTPTLAMSPDGDKVVVAWTSDENQRGFPEVLARVLINKQPLGEIEIIPERGHKASAHSFIWKNGLACSNDEIVFVWSENRTDRNLDIYCKTTNWDLTSIEQIVVGKDKLKIWPSPASEVVYFGGNGNSFEIFDVNGKSVNKLFEAVWDLKDQYHQKVPSGIYFVRNERNETGKIIVH